MQNKRYFLLIVAISIVASAAIGYWLGASNINAHNDDQEQKLKISAVCDLSADSFSISCPSVPELEILCSGFSSLTLEHNGKEYSLADAITSGLIHPEEIVAYARMDSHVGFCTETFLSANGLSCFFYRYDQFQLRVICDVYETPANGPVSVYDIAFFAAEKSPDTSTLYLDVGQKYPTPIDQEDWGLTFEVIATGNNYITMNVKQFGGQIIGYLKPEDIALITESGEWLEKLDPSAAALIFTTYAISGNDTNELTVEWTKAFGMLPSGNYTMKIWFSDIYTKDQIPPLSRNFYDQQSYYIEFTIP